MRWIRVLVIILSSSHSYSQNYAVVDDLRNYDLESAGSISIEYDRFTIEMIEFQIDFLRHYEAYNLKFDTLKSYPSKTDLLGQFYFYINKGDYLFYSFEDKNIEARNEYLKGIELAVMNGLNQLVCEGLKKLLTLNRLNYLNNRYVEMSYYLDMYEDYAYDEYEKNNIKYYQLLFNYRNSPTIGSWNNLLANDLLVYVKNSDNYIFNARVYNLLANYSFNVLNQYEQAKKYNLVAKQNLDSITYNYKTTVLKQVFTGIIRHSVISGHLNVAKSYLDSLELVSSINWNKVEKDYKRYYYYYKSAMDTAASRYKSAYENFRKYTVLLETGEIYSNKDALRLLETQYQTQQRQIEIEKQQIEIDNRDKFLVVITTFLIVLTGISVVLVMAFKNIRKKNLKIQTLMRELHHRVKNNLQVISSLLGLQSMRLEDDNARRAVSESKGRIHAMSLIHQKLYQTDTIDSLDIQEYIKNLVTELAHAYDYHARAQITVEVPKEPFDADISLSIGLIINELVSNAFKHAFIGIENPRLEVRLIKVGGNLYSLNIRDNGKGLLADFDTKQLSSFGMKLVELLIRQLSGTMQVGNKNGLSYEIKFQVA